MKEAIANAGVFNLIIIFVIILLAFFIGSLGYSKAFKVKNLIVYEIEKDEGYDAKTTEVNIEDMLGKIGYRMNTGFDSRRCPVEDGQSAINTNSDYQYCVYRFEHCTDKQGNICIKKNTYYRVISYMYFDVPIVGQLISVPVIGETTSFTEINS